MDILRFLHLICGTTFFGIMIASFFYIGRSLQKNDHDLIRYSLKASYFGDGLIFIILFIQLISAIHLVSYGHFTPAIPWIFIAYHAFAFIILLWFAIFILKIASLSKKDISSFAKKIFFILNSIVILVFIIITHDAVMQSTWFDFLFRK